MRKQNGLKPNLDPGYNKNGGAKSNILAILSDKSQILAFVNLAPHNFELSGEGLDKQILCVASSHEYRWIGNQLVTNFYGRQYTQGKACELFWMQNLMGLQ